MVSGLWKRPLVGLGTAVVIFSAYMAGEYALNKVFQHPESGKAKSIWHKEDEIANSPPTRIKGDH